MGDSNVHSSAGDNLDVVLAGLGANGSEVYDGFTAIPLCHTPGEFPRQKTADFYPRANYSQRCFQLLSSDHNFAGINVERVKRVSFL